ncbi:MAG TPA: hypothetical protein VJ375_09415 [Gaiellaceae bacterium]|jgi:hypothetical protein|nr:hypothetical protein [Gaiellaceae bacterium]
MLNLFGTSKTKRVEVCERCGEVCDAACRADAAREAARNTVPYGRRLA